MENSSIMWDVAAGYVIGHLFLRGMSWLFYTAADLFEDKYFRAKVYRKAWKVTKILAALLVGLIILISLIEKIGGK